MLFLVITERMDLKVGEIYGKQLIFWEMETGPVLHCFVLHLPFGIVTVVSSHELTLRTLFFVYRQSIFFGRAKLNLGENGCVCFRQALPVFLIVESFPTVQRGRIYMVNKFNFFFPFVDIVCCCCGSTPLPPVLLRLFLESLAEMHCLFVMK